MVLRLVNALAWSECTISGKLCRPARRPLPTMRVADFNFELPDTLIARHPLAERRASRLLVLDGPTGELAHKHFGDLLDYLRP